MRQLDADVVALQEVEGWDWSSLARSLGYRVILGGTRPMRFGNALLVRAPVTSLHRLDLSVPGREARGALDAEISLGSGGLRLVATHLGLRASERRQQAARLGAHVAERSSAAPLVLLGDLNEWGPWARSLRPLAASVGRLSRIPTFPSRRPVLPLDRAAWRAPGFGARLTAIHSADVRHASDHLPLRLELRPAAR